MKQTHQRNLAHLILIYLLVVITGMSAQEAPLTVRESSFPNLFYKNNIRPTRFHVAGNGFQYFLDTNSGQVAAITPDGLFFGAGYGSSPEALFDPVDIVSYYPDVWIIDHSHSSLIKYDRRLNVSTRTVLDAFYPGHVEVDPWGAVILYSKQSNTIHTVVNGKISILPFIDLNELNLQGEEIIDWFFSDDGELGILMAEIGECLIFNRFGRLIRRYGTGPGEYRFVLKTAESWVAVSPDGSIKILGSDRQLSVPIVQEILDVSEENGNIWFLTANNVLTCRISD